MKTQLVDRSVSSAHRPRRPAPIAVEKSLPKNLDLERFVLGALLLDVSGTDEAFSVLHFLDFFLPEHRSIFRGLLSQIRSGLRPDLPGLVDLLSSSGDLDSISGGAGYLAGLPDGLPRVCPLVSWCQILREKSQLRDHADRAERILDLVLSANGDSKSVLQEVEKLSAQLRTEVWAETKKVRFRTGKELAAQTAEKLAWVIDGYVPLGALVELDAKIKCGKTTFLLAAINAVLDGATFLGRETTKTAVVYLSEQPDASFRQALTAAGLLDRDDFHVLSYFDVRGLPWPEVADSALRESQRVGAQLLVVDTLGQFAQLAGDSENDAGAALAAMEPLQSAASKGLAVVCVRHERKSSGEIGDSARGSSAFGGAADIILRLCRPEGRMRKSIRRLEGLSRFAETPTEVLIELRDGKYVSLGAPHEVAVEESKNSLLAAAPETEEKALTLDELAEKAGVKSRSTAQRAIDKLLESGSLRQCGAGRRGSPLRFFLAEN
jgi:hypothetical protein